MNNTCELAVLYAKSYFITSVQFFQIIMAVTSLFILAMNFLNRCHHRESIVLHKSLKIVVCNMVFLFFMHSFAILVLQLRHQINYRTYTNPCDLWISYCSCVLVKYTINMAQIGFTLFHAILCFERSMAVLFPARYESSGVKCGIIGTIFMWFIIIGWHAWLLSGESVGAQLPFCSLTSSNNSYKWYFEYGTLLVVDFLVLTTDIVITRINKESLKNYLYKSIFSNNYLRNAYQLNENARTMSIILPISVAHSIVFLLFLSLTFTIRLLFHNLDEVTFKGLIECGNSIVCVYTSVIPMVYFRLRKNLQPRKVQISPMGQLETEKHFEMLKQAFNSDFI